MFASSVLLNGLLTVLSVGFLWLTGGWLAVLWKAPVLETLFHYYMLTTVALIVFSQCLFVQQANFNFRNIFWCNLARQGVFFGFVVVYYFQNKAVTLVDLSVWQIVGAVVGSAVALVLTHSHWHPLRFASVDWTSRLFHFGKYVMGTNLSSMIYKSVDKFMLGALLSSTAPVAVYDLAIRINSLNEVPTLSLAAIVFPESARQAVAKGKEGLKQLYEKSVGITLALVVPGTLFICLFPEWIITLAAGAQYTDTVSILRFTALYGLFLPFAVQFGTTFDAMGKPQLNFVFVVGGAVLNGVLNYFFIQRWGLYGAVVASLTTFSLTFLGNQWLLRRYLKVELSNTLRYAWQFYGSLFRYAKTQLFDERKTAAKEVEIKTWEVEKKEVNL